MDTQYDLMTIVPESNSGNVDRCILDCVKQFQSDKWLIPKFQRDFVWSDAQIKSWIESIISKKSIGVIVTYQLRGGGASYIADGLQRLTATIRFIKSPESYGFQFGEEQARVYCESFDITVQHRIYETHREAMTAFQRLNMGTSLTPREFYSGELALLDLGKIIIDRVPLCLTKYEARILKFSKRRNRSKEDQAIRDAYGLFLQYVSNTDILYFWDVSSTGVGRDNKKPVIEKALYDYIVSNHLILPDIEKQINDFENFIAQRIAQIENILSDCGGKGTSMSITTLRWLLHLSIWRKNSNKPAVDYEDFVRKLFSYSINKYGRVTSRLEIETKPGSISIITLGMSQLNHLAEMCRALDSQLHGAKVRTKKNVAPGYHNSHVLPFSQYGDSESFIETATSNMIRGNRPVK